MVRFSNNFWKILLSSLLFCPSLSFADGGSEANCLVNDFWVLSRVEANRIFDGCKLKHRTRYDNERNGQIYSATTEFAVDDAIIQSGVAATCIDNENLNDPNCKLVVMAQLSIKYDDTTVETTQWSIDKAGSNMWITDLRDSPDPNNPGKRITEGVRNVHLRPVAASEDSEQLLEWITYIELLDSTLAQQIEATTELQQKKLEQKNRVLSNTTFPAQSHLRLRLSELADEYEREGSAIKFLNFIKYEVEDLNPFLDR